MGSFATIYEPSASALIVRIFGDTREQDVIACFREYERMLEENVGHGLFNVILNVDEKAHSSIAVLRLIREYLENQEYREHIVNILAVIESPARCAMNNASGGELRSFTDEDQAVRYLAARTKEI
jgi:hypothetical protein